MFILMSNSTKKFNEFGERKSYFLFSGGETDFFHFYPLPKSGPPARQQLRQQQKSVLT